MVKERVALIYICDAAGGCQLNRCIKSPRAVVQLPLGKNGLGNNEGELR